MHNVLVRPVFTEKSLQDAENSKFTFVVSLVSSKDAVKKAVEEAYKVHVVDIATTVVKGKVQRVGKRRTKTVVGKYKKAVVRVKKGEKIDIFELGEKKK